MHWYVLSFQTNEWLKKEPGQSKQRRAKSFGASPFKQRRTPKVCHCTFIILTLVIKYNRLSHDVVTCDLHHKWAHHLTNDYTSLPLPLRLSFSTFHTLLPSFVFFLVSFHCLVSSFLSFLTCPLVICPSVSVCLSAHPATWLPGCPPACLFFCLSVSLSVCTCLISFAFLLYPFSFFVIQRNVVPVFPFNDIFLFILCLLLTCQEKTRGEQKTHRAICEREAEGLLVLYCVFYWM